MRILRALGGSLLWILAGVLGLVGVLLCATIILLPLGIPVLMLARKVFALAMALMLPRKVTHPVDELGKSARRGAKKAKGSMPAPDVDTKRLKKSAKKARKKGKSLLKH
jgi:hypothetical protein